ncbi:MAG: hypothetical protein M1813_009228 [Trichoglossum hirsutum]|nr:MAG: hypothetical protein M1813_009228 [Trichoglossum hirsutum]
MTPRRGGSRTGGGDGSGHSADSRWNHLIMIYTDPDMTAAVFNADIVIASLCLCFLAVSVLFVWPFKVKAKERWIYKWFGFPIAAGGGVSWVSPDSGLVAISAGYFIIIILALLAAQAGAHVYESFRLIFVFANWFLLQTSVLIFSFTYSIIHNRFAVIWRDAVPRLRVWQSVHYVLICLITVLWIVDFIIYLRPTLDYLDSEGPVPELPLASVYRKFDTTLHIVYLIVALDVLICAITVFRGDRSRRLNSRISTHLLFIIVPSILIANLFLAVFSIYFTLLNHSNSFTNPLPDSFTDPLPNPFTNLLNLVFTGIPIVVALSGIVLVGLQGDWHVEQEADIARRSAVGGHYAMEVVR